MIKTSQSNSRRAFLVLNYLALVLAPCALFYAGVLAPMNCRMRVVTLDRDHVFNEASLQRLHPVLAENLRNNVADWIQEPSQSAAVCFAFAFGVLAFANIVGYHTVKHPTSPPGSNA